MSCVGKLHRLYPTSWTKWCLIHETACSFPPLLIRQAGWEKHGSFSFTPNWETTSMIGIGAFICLWISNDWQLHSFFVNLHLSSCTCCITSTFQSSTGSKFSPRWLRTNQASGCTSGCCAKSYQWLWSQCRICSSKWLNLEMIWVRLAIDDMSGDGKKRYC